MTPTDEENDRLQTKRTLQGTIFSLDADRARANRRRDEVVATIHRFQQIIREHEQFIKGEEERLKKLDADIAEIEVELVRAKRKLQNL